MPYEPKQLGGQYLEAVVVRNEDDGTLQQLVTKSGEVLIDFRDVTFLATANTVAPVVTPGTATTGTVLSCTTGTWTHRPLSYSYQWYKAGAEIVGETSATYTVVVGDLTNEITCKVAATNRAGTASAVASNGVTPTA